MAITIDYSTFVISIPRADMLDVTVSGTEIRQLNLNELRVALNDLMDDPEGMPFPTNHVHTPPLTVAGVTLARAVEILPPYTVEFEDGAFNVNIVGGNTNISDRVNKNMVGVNTSNSAGLQDPFALQAAAFFNTISIDVNSIYSGTVFPTGTRAYPVNNMADALTIAESRGLRNLAIMSAMTLTLGDFSEGYTFIGDNPNVMMTLQDAPNVIGCEFKNMTVTGDLDGNNTLRECALIDINLFNGFIFQCGVMGTIALGGTAPATILQCFSLVAGAGPGMHPWVDFGGQQDTPLVIRDWQGGLGFKNCTSQNQGTSIDISSGRCVFDSTITAGLHVVRGLGDVADDSGPGATVTDLTVQTGGSTALTTQDKLDIAEEVWKAPTDSTHTPAGSFGEMVKKKLLSTAKFLGLK